jgi:hypothetical protein
MHTVIIEKLPITKRQFSIVLKKHHGNYDGWDAGQGSFREFFIFNRKVDALAFAKQIESVGGSATISRIKK